MATGCDVAMSPAWIMLMWGDPRGVVAALDASRRICQAIRQNLFLAFAYTAVGLQLAAMGLLNPMLAGAAMASASA
jgi:P-type Cu+ transporter